MRNAISKTYVMCEGIFLNFVEAGTGQHQSRKLTHTNLLFSHWENMVQVLFKIFTLEKLLICFTYVSNCFTRICAYIFKFLTIDDI
jgi:hypothetical protein